MKDLFNHPSFKIDKFKNDDLWNLLFNKQSCLIDELNEYEAKEGNITENNFEFQSNISIFDSIIQKDDDLLNLNKFYF